MMKKSLYLLPSASRLVLRCAMMLIALIGFSHLQAQTTLYTETFEGATISWDLNTTEIGGTGATDENYWILNDDYTGLPPLIANTPNQPAAVTGGPNSFYMHVTNGDNNGVFSLFDANFQSPTSGNITSSMHSDISTVGDTGVSFSFYYLCKGKANGTDYYGQLYYSVDGGTNWIASTKMFNKGTWTFLSVSNAAFDNQAKLRFAFQWVQGGTNGGSDPPLSVDEINIKGYPVTSCPVAITNQTSTNSTNCTTPNGTITITATAATTYTINAGTAITNTTGAFTGLAPGTYTVTAGNGTCSKTGTSITITGPTTTAPTLTSNSPLCAGATLNLTASTIANATYAWSGANGFTSAQQNPSKANVTIADGGTYTVTATVSGCTSTASITVTVNAGPTPPTAGSNSPVCQGATLNLTSTTVAGATYGWTGPNGFTSAQQNPTIANTTAAANGDYIVIATVTGCAPVSDTVTVVITPGPPAITASNTGPVCTGQLVSVSSSTVAGVTYSWTGPNGFTSSVQNPPAFTASTATAGVYKVTISNGGCGTSTDSTTVVVNPTPVAPIINSNSPLCSGQTLNLTVATQTNATYAWSGPNGFTSAQQNPSVNNVTTADAGTYKVTVTIGTCGSTVDSTIVAIGAGAPPVTATNNGPICTGQTLQLDVTQVGTATYSWTGPNGFTSASQSPSIPNIAAGNAGDYIVVVTSGSCGSSSDTTTVSVVTSPAAPTVTNNGPVCVGQTVTLTSTIVPGATYSWSGPNGFSGNTNVESVTNVSQADGGIYTITASVVGCGSVTASTTVTISSGLPAPVISANIHPLCQGDTLELSVPALNNATYAWSGPHNYVSIMRDPFRAGTDTSFAGIYSVTVTQNGCVGTSTVTVAVSDTPIVKAGSDGAHCFDQVVIFNAGQGASYIWSTGDTTRALTATGTAVYSVTVTDANGCKGSDYIDFVRFPQPDTTTFQQIGDSLISSWDTASGYQWYLNGDTIAGATGQNLVIAESGDYYLVVTDGNGCSSRSEVIHADYVGIDEVELSTTLDIYPNPATGKFNIHGLGSIDRNIKMTMYNAIGSRVIDNNYHITSGQTIQVGIDQLAQGVYMIQIQAGTQTFTKKLVVQ